MRSSWHIKSAELRRRRLDAMMTIVELAKRSGLGVRTIQHAEHSNDGPVQLMTVDLSAKALGCERTDIATCKEKSAKAPNATAQSASPRAATDRVRMSDLQAIDKTLPEPDPFDDDGELLPMVTVRRYNHCATAFQARDGERYAVEGTVEVDHGLSPSEAKLLGARSGDSARFDVRIPVGGDGHTLCATVFTDRAATTIEMQDALHKKTLCIVRLVALEDLERGEGLMFFMRERPSPWCLLVERVVRVESPKPKKRRAERRPKNRR
jgi:hypothetical protein